MSKMNFRSMMQQKAQETEQATKKFGFIGQVVIRGGLVPKFAKFSQWSDCFAAYNENEPESVTREKCVAKATRLMDREPTDFTPVITISVIPKTSKTPNYKLKDQFISMESKDENNPRTWLRQADFLFDHWSPELEGKINEEVWVHICWQRLTEQYGGNLSLVGEDASGQSGLIVTYLPNEKAASDLFAKLSSDELTVDDLCVERGYDIAGVREALKAAYAATKGSGETSTDAAAPALTDIGKATKKTYETAEFFLSAKTVGYIQKNYDALGGDVEATADKCHADPGDVAIVTGNKTYFTDLMAATGLGQNEALVKVARDTGLASVVDLANFLGVEEPPF